MEEEAIKSNDKSDSKDEETKEETKEQVKTQTSTLSGSSMSYHNYATELLAKLKIKNP